MWCRRGWSKLCSPSSCHNRQRPQRLYLLCRLTLRGSYNLLSTSLKRARYRLSQPHRPQFWRLCLRKFCCRYPPKIRTANCCISSWKKLAKWWPMAVLHCRLWHKTLPASANKRCCAGHSIRSKAALAWLGWMSLVKQAGRWSKCSMPGWRNKKPCLLPCRPCRCKP